MALNQPAFWVNADGLFIPFGRSTGAERYVGEFCDGGETREVQAVIPLDQLPAATETILSETVRFPTGACFEEVEVYVRTSAATGTDIDLGFIALDRTTHNASADADGLIVNLATATMVAGRILKFRAASSSPAGTTGGALITTPTPLAEPCLLTISPSGPAFTAGLLYVRIRYKIDPTVGQIGN